MPIYLQVMIYFNIKELATKFWIEATLGSKLKVFYLLSFVWI